MKSKQDKNFIKKAFDHTMYALKRLFSWVKRAFWSRNVRMGMEKIESPARLLRENFFRKKAAVFALWFLAQCLDIVYSHR